MPAELERKLKHRAEAMARAGKLKRRKGMSKEESKNAYIYGTMRRTGWKPSREK